jgi:hypothetical protein
VKTITLLVIITALAVAVAVAGYYGYTNYQEQVLLEQSIARFEQEKQALQAAQESKDIVALNRFITDHPQSDWLEKAIYERDKLAYHQASETNQASALEKFINQYTGSQWISQAQNRLQHLKQEQKLLAEIQLKQQKLDIQRQQISEQQAATVITDTNTQQTKDKAAEVPTPATKASNSSLSGRDRVARALAIYQKQRQQEQHTDTKQRQEQLREEQKKRRCLQIKDQIAQYNNRRIKFYDLDGSGKRVYLNKQQVSINRKKIQEEYKQNCE